MAVDVCSCIRPSCGVCLLHKTPPHNYSHQLWASASLLCNTVTQTHKALWNAATIYTVCRIQWLQRCQFVGRGAAQG